MDQVQPSNPKSKDYVKGINPEIAKEDIIRFTSNENRAEGVLYKIEDLMAYETKFKNIIKDKPAPDHYEYRVGHYFAKKPDGTLYFIVAPVLVNIKDSKDIKDVLSSKGDFNTELKIDNEFHFFFNEGQKWP